MTAEEKAKRYDEALEWMRKVYPALTGADKEDAEYYFPELKESEDERIIRVIIDALYSHTNSINLLSSRGYQMEDIEAWFEKQKEKKPLEYLPKEKVYDIMSNLTELSCSKLIPFQSREFQKIDEITSDVRDLLYYPIEQKPEEWSEEDENNTGWLIAFLEGKIVYHSDELHKSIIKWLRLLRSRKWVEKTTKI